MNVLDPDAPSPDTAAAAAVGQDSPAALFDADYARRALDELFVATRQYATGAALGELFGFMRRFRFYSPFNAMLLHVQNPGSTFAAPASRWRRQYDRVIKPGARPLVILQPMGPVLFVFDVSDTEPASSASPPLPRAVTEPFEPEGKAARVELVRLRKNAVRDGILVTEAPQGAEAAGRIARTKVKGQTLKFSDEHWTTRRYDIVLNSNHTPAARFVTLVHELAHLYCGHLGPPFEGCKWWPDRRGLGIDIMEFEAEAVAFLVSTRLGVNPPSAQYLAGYLGQNKELPSISFERLLVSAGLIESMCTQSLPPNRAPKRPSSSGPGDSDRT